MTDLPWLPPNTRDQIDRAVKSIGEALGDAVVAVLLVGPAVHGDRPDRARNPELLVIADVLAPATVATLAEAIRPHMHKGIRVRTLTEQELLRSVDVYALEISEWKDHHVRLTGRDVLAEVSVSPVHLRLDLERAVRGLGRRIRNRMLHSLAARSRDLDRVLLEALERLVVVARQCLRFAGREPADGEQATLSAFADYVQVDAAPLLAIQQRLREGKRPPRGGPSDELAQLEAVLQMACQVIDAAEVEG